MPPDIHFIPGDESYEVYYELVIGAAYVHLPQFHVPSEAQDTPPQGRVTTELERADSVNNIVPPPLRRRLGRSIDIIPQLVNDQAARRAKTPLADDVDGSDVVGEEDVLHQRVMTPNAHKGHAATISRSVSRSLSNTWNYVKSVVNDNRPVMDPASYELKTWQISRTSHHVVTLAMRKQPDLEAYPPLDITSPDGGRTAPVIVFMYWREEESLWEYQPDEKPHWVATVLGSAYNSAKSYAPSTSGNYVTRVLPNSSNIRLLKREYMTKRSL